MPLSNHNDPSTKPKPRRSWKPATLLDVTGKDPNYTYRWLSNNPIRIARAKAEGWEILNTTTLREEKGPAPTLADGSPVGGTVTKRELILARMPKELAESRAKYFQDQADSRQTEQQFKTEAGGLAYGEVIRE